ncbi:MAG: TIGR00730 family Rossman fold protein [Clostridia bacterium]|nr:TIGR00730 family Rossman fold protein [Clostridia bacterium]
MKNICVYGASSASIDKVYLDAAYELGRLIAERGYGLVFGAGDTGVMGACARGAHDAQGRVIGVLPIFMAEVPDISYQDCDELIVTETMRERKRKLEELSFAYVAAPGGIGTFEEFFEILTLKQLQRHEKALVVLNTQDYYRPLLTLLENCVKQHFAADSMLSLYGVASTPTEAVAYVETYQHQALPAWNHGRST